MCIFENTIFDVAAYTTLWIKSETKSWILFAFRSEAIIVSHLGSDLFSQKTYFIPP